ncbi:MaoC family dehydratase [Novosphingobium sp. 9U]|uniref:MaoC family dehydratase n=1 Tax=Novosphingobium sp. 9U TaxID=2653158 RepID=UPI0012F14E38|nr:MaoC family dehydratase [Novosphingobium sp. 9U]VWX49941.1 MaoC-like dehydratase [Novosphingobium sp. 9U]
MSTAPAQSATVGFTLPERRFHVTQALISRYADVSGDWNPLHLDPEFAKTTKFGRTIAHGMMTLAFVSQMMRDWAGAAWENQGELAVTFVAPVFAEDEVVVRAEVKESAAGMTLCKVECWVDDRLTLTGEAGIRGEIANG